MPTKTTQTSNASQNQQYSGTTTPTEQPGWGGLTETLRNQILNNLQNPQVVPDQYAATGIGNVNQTYKTLGQSLQSKLVSRGLTGAGIEGNAMTTLENARGGGVVDVLNEVPKLQRQWNQEDLMNAMKMYALRPIGSTTSGTASGTSSNKTETSTMDWMKMISSALAIPALFATGGASAATGAGGIFDSSKRYIGE
jgi:hypothetical protein